MGEYLAVEVEGDKITLTKTTPPEPKSVEKTIEEKINDLDRKQLKELNAYLDSLKK